ncbi:uncharacterized protein [Venturia canescens]|uniref:uncharacterized protein n=1 Tax=Venturia canescens TaxID=32260 RepID=UPI001C9D2913|nr:uncharacterized protein LOC122412626 [Venturia canescens]XP_043278261.1 uncharacterized protein LOC122412626 [Venturia canescens]XP_043278262.1 uncharacterized protein LOC122412626 [Venturia canescens]XP_043278263.1 uncharacterized protein LOC122412626 [Venturia canescens]XP_043278264.1 uncharacterized protein LOC122412626 [Venturia canescens]XP_043278265.1 uncharacterized protein LOC122412626 [Venturia canescens]XP_043278266.1 uncharacterized protein LOC122412626 [Venturia canescens]XP_0
MSGNAEFAVGLGVASGPSLAAAQQGQGVAALLVMLAVLCFIFAYCCWGAPFCRSLCRRHCCCRLEDPEPDPRFGNSDQAMVATPTIILLPHGRMLVVDGTIFTQFQADTTGLDLVELGESVIRAQRNPRSINRHQLQSSQGSILEMDAETPSKDSLGSIGCFPPPTYESIYGKDEGDMPPSYSDILLHRFANLPYEIELHDHCHDGKEEMEMHSLDGCPYILSNPINTLTYPYTSVTSFSSQSFPRRNLSRNPSLISNPLDDYYVDNELGVYRIGRMNVSSIQDVSSNVDAPRSVVSTNANSGNVPPIVQHFPETESRYDIQHVHDDQTRCRSADNESTNTGNHERGITLGGNQVVQDSQNFRITEGSSSRRQNNDTEARRDRSYTPRNVHFQNFHDPQPESSQNANQPIDIIDNTISRPRHSRDYRDDDRSRNDETRARVEDDENNDFGALADIRESRV